LLIGKNKEKTIIDGQKTGSVIRVEANNVVVSGFTLQNNGGSGKEDAGITLYSANGNMVANSILVNNTIGIAIYSSSNGNVISGNYVRSNYRNGIFVFSSDDNKIYNNNIQNNQIGFYGDAARASSIYSNNFIDNIDQAYDNSGLNSWDDGKSGNYWSNFKGSGAFNILGGANARDNYPLSNAVSIKDVAITTPTEKPEYLKDLEETGQSSPGFTGLVLLLSIITAIAFKYGKKDH
jgi:parallel beta-helix repeat protein